MKLYHYTCSHGLAGITLDGFLRTHPQPVLGGVSLVWLTDLEVPDRAGLGLTSYLLHCDRTEHRIEVEAHAVHWPRYARQFPTRQRQMLDLAEGALPMHWYVCAQPVPVAVAVAS